MSKYHYVYHISRRIPDLPQLQYIGVRSCNCPPEEDTSYWGSSKYLKKDMKLHGKENYRKDIWFVFDNRQDAVQREIELHNSFEVAINPLFYNCAKSSSTKFDTTGVKWGMETRKKQSNKAKNRSRDVRIAMANAQRGKKHSVETKMKMSKSHKGKNTWSKIELPEKMIVELYNNGVSSTEIASMLSVSRRTISRRLKSLQELIKDNN